MSRERKPRTDDVWPQRLFVLGKIDALIESGMPIEEVAKALDLRTTSSLEVGWRYNYDRAPHRDKIGRIAKLLGLTERQVYDPSPETDEPKDELTLAKEALSGAMGSEALSGLSDEQILAAYRVAMTTAKAMLAQ